MTASIILPFGAGGLPFLPAPAPIRGGIAVATLLRRRPGLRMDEVDAAERGGGASCCAAETVAGGLARPRSR